MITTFRVAALTSAFCISSMVAQEAAEAPAAPPTFQEIKDYFPSAQNEGIAPVSNYATVELKNDLVFLDGEDGDKLLQSWGNLPGQLDGLIMPRDTSWAITFNFDSIGYVKDDEKESLDAAEILEQQRESQKEANKMRAEAGIGTLDITGWAVPPQYNEATNNLEWALILKDSDGMESVNHDVRILGRKGVVNATLICDPSQLDELRPILASTLDGFEYTSGNKYAEFREGDKIAEYGLTGLIVGGSAFVIWKFWKPIGIGLLAIGAFIKKMLGRATGTSSSEGRLS